MKAIKKILFPIDFTSHYETLLPWLASLAEKFDATVYVLYIATDLSHFASFVPHGNIESFQQEVEASARKKMAAAVQEHFQAFSKLETRVESGAPAAKILDVADKEKIDLIIMGAHGRKGLDRAIFGSVAAKVVRNASCAVLTIRP
jgi:nucleotide-binding universal stress UspA family protein